MPRSTAFFGLLCKGKPTRQTPRVDDPIEVCGLIDSVRGEAINSGGRPRNTRQLLELGARAKQARGLSIAPRRPVPRGIFMAGTREARWISGCKRSVSRAGGGSRPLGWIGHDRGAFAQ